MSAMTYSSSFVIPRKKKAEAGDIKRVREVSPESREFTDTIAPILKQSFYNQQLKESVRLGKCLIVDNKELSAKLEARRKVMKSRGYQDSQLNYSYAFLHVTKDEIEQICDEGLSVENSIDASLGDASQGIYLCKHADLTTPAPPAANCEDTIVIFRILKGRSKQVGVQSVDLDPDYTFDSHIAKPMATTSNTKVSRIDLYLQNRIYLYEYAAGSMDVVDTPTCACPIAVVNCQFPEELRWYASHSAWRGNLSVGSTSFTASLSSHYTTLKIHDLGQTLDVNALVPWEQCVAYQPLAELIASDHAAAIAKRREVVLSKGLNAGLRASYWTISSSDNHYRSFYDNMKSSRVAGIACLPGGTNLIVMPTGELSALLGLPNFSDRTLHCVVVSYRSVTLGINFSANDALDKREVMFRQPTLVEQVDGVSERTVDAFRESFLQWHLMEQQAVMAQIDEAVAAAELVPNPVVAMRDPRVRMRLTKIGNGLSDFAASSTTFKGAADGDGSSVSTHYSDKAAFGTAIDALTERSYNEESSNLSDNDALVVDDGGEESGEESGRGGGFSPMELEEDTERQNEKSCAPLFSEDSSLCLQLDEALSEVSSVAHTVDSVKRPPKKKIKIDQTLPTTPGAKGPRISQVDSIRKCINELKAIQQSPTVDSTSNDSTEENLDTPQSPPPQEESSPTKPLIIAFDSGDADDDNAQISERVSASKVPSSPAVVPVSSASAATVPPPAAAASVLPSHVDVRPVTAEQPASSAPVATQQDTDLRRFAAPTNPPVDRSTSWRNPSQQEGTASASSAPTAAPPRAPAGATWRNSANAAGPVRTRWDEAPSSTTWRRSGAPPLLPQPVPPPTGHKRAVPLLPLPTDAPQPPAVDAVDKHKAGPRRWESPPAPPKPPPLSALPPPAPSGFVATEATMSRHGIVVPDELVFTRASCSPEVLEELLKHFQHGLTSGVSFWSIKLHSQVVLKLAEAKNMLEKNSPAHTRASKVLGLLHRYRQRDVIELLPYHPCDDRSRDAEDYLPCVVDLSKRVGDYSKTVFLTNLDPNSRMGKMYENSGISVMSLDVLLKKYDIK